MIFSCETLEWDSNFFGYKVGRVNLNNSQTINTLLTEIRSFTDYKLIYIFSDYPIHVFENYFFEKKITYEKLLSSFTNSSKTEELMELPFKYDYLLELAILSGKYSRFKLDEKFENNEFEKLYKCWLDNSLNKIIADGIVLEFANENLAGFGTLSKVKNHVSKVGLIAVGKEFQGKGIGSKIITRLENEAIEKGAKSIEIDTQEINIPANYLYKKNGYTVKNIKYIYHYWN